MKSTFINDKIAECAHIGKLIFQQTPTLTSLNFRFTDVAISEVGPNWELDKDRNKFTALEVVGPLETQTIFIHFHSESLPVGYVHTV